MTDGRPVSFRAAGVLAKADRLRIQGEHIGARIDRLRVLITSRQERGMARARCWWPSSPSWKPSGTASPGGVPG